MEEWLGLAKQGDRQALEDIVQRYEPLVRSEVKRFALNDWEEACQQARLAIVEAVFLYDPSYGCYFGTFLKRRVWAALRTWQRKEWRWRRELPLSHEDWEEGGLHEPASTVFADTDWRQWLAGLSEREQQVIIRSVVEGYSLKELAAMYHVSLETVKTWKKRALKKLRQDAPQWLTDGIV